MSDLKSRGFANVGALEDNRNIKSLQNNSGNQVTMGKGVPRQIEGAIGDITVRTIPSIGLIAYIKTGSGLHDINDLVPLEAAKWRDMILDNSWVIEDTDASVDEPQFIKDNLGFVYLRGVIKGGSTAAAIITTLPPGYRPATNQFRLILNNSAADPEKENLSVLKIATNGEINQSDGADTTALLLNGVVFNVGQVLSKRGWGGGDGSHVEGTEDVGGGVG